MLTCVLYKNGNKQDILLEKVSEFYYRRAVIAGLLPDIKTF